MDFVPDFTVSAGENAVLESVAKAGRLIYNNQ